MDRIAGHVPNLAKAPNDSKVAGAGTIVEMGPARTKDIPHSELTRQYQHGTVRNFADGLR